MTYWDWTIDSDDLSQSPVLSPDTTKGFGGNGLNGGFVSPSRPNPLTMCVMDGAFANFTVAFYGGSLRPHCLNRGFNDGANTLFGKYQQQEYNASKISQILRDNKNFSTFATQLENEPHGAIHQTIGGDMIPSTSPNGKLAIVSITLNKALMFRQDPLFFLHHGQIDRLWWMWQQEDLSVRSQDFSGIRILPTGEVASESASLFDILPMLGLAEDVAVQDVMSTNTTLLRYRY